MVYIDSEDFVQNFYSSFYQHSDNIQSLLLTPASRSGSISQLSLNIMLFAMLYDIHPELRDSVVALGIPQSIVDQDSPLRLHNMPQVYYCDVHTSNF